MLNNKTSRQISKNKMKVLVALSGGVDSSVAALLLKQQGYAPVGVFLKFWSSTQEHTKQNTNQHISENTCCNLEALESARAVCDKLDIPFFVFDVKKEFKKEVVDYFISEYESGRTPNPCVLCNKKIKFGWLIDKAKKMGCDKIATGHYARIACELKTQNSNLKTQISNIKSQKANSEKQIANLFKAKDKNKDQTYFLWQLSLQQLSKILFPLGDYTKEEVRKIAKKNHLPTYQKKESQDICFVGKSISDFLSSYVKKLNQPGDIIDLAGNIIGRHKGLCYYTIGQRKNLGGDLRFKISDLRFDKDSIKKVFVVKLNVRKNQLVIGEEKDLCSKTLVAEKLNWIISQPPKPGLVIDAKIRYSHKKEKCKIIELSNFDKTKEQYKNIKIEFNKPVRAITSGQSVVFYNKSQLIGGAIIK